MIIGSGAREHALAWKVAQSSQVSQVWVAPGNAGTAQEPKTKNVAIDPLDIKALIDFAKQQQITLTIVGPEGPLAAGIVDQFNAQALMCFGPCRKASRLESSKAFSKDFMVKHNIPTARYASFSDVNKALTYIKQQSLPLVIKADGLASGKGVLIAQSYLEAEEAVRSMITDKQFGDAGQRIVVEEFIEGEELSFIVLSDGKNVLPLESAQDHKRRDNQDKGPNTGGMGAFSPAAHFTPTLNQTILTQIIHPTIKALSEQGTPYIGFLYAGLMINESDEPKVLEFNCRLGDPETQPMMMRLQSDLVNLCLAAIEGRLNEMSIQWSKLSALSVVLTAGGYPLSYQVGDTIQGLKSELGGDSKIFHAGTAFKGNQVITNGGRVLTVTALGNTILEAQEKAYQIAETIHWPNCYYRTDIGCRALRLPTLFD